MQVKDNTFYKSGRPSLGEAHLWCSQFCNPVYSHSVQVHWHQRYSPMSLSPWMLLTVPCNLHKHALHNGIQKLYLHIFYIQCLVLYQVVRLCYLELSQDSQMKDLMLVRENLMRGDKKGNIRKCYRIHSLNEQCSRSYPYTVSQFKKPLLLRC